MGISLEPRHLKRCADLSRLFMKYGRSDLVKRAGLEEVLAGEEPAAAGGGLALVLNILLHDEKGGGKRGRR